MKTAVSIILCIALAASQGFSPARLERAGRFVQGAVDQGQYAGAVILIARHGHVVQSQGFGYRVDAIFQIYSMTKPITSVAALHAHRRLCSGREVERPGRRPPERRALG